MTAWAIIIKWCFNCAGHDYIGQDYMGNDYTGLDCIPDDVVHVVSNTAMCNDAMRKNAVCNDAMHQKMLCIDVVHSNVMDRCHLVQRWLSFFFVRT